MESYPYPVKEGKRYINLNPGKGEKRRKGGTLAPRGAYTALAEGCTPLLQCIQDRLSLPPSMGG